MGPRGGRDTEEKEGEAKNETMQRSGRYPGRPFSVAFVSSVAGLTCVESTRQRVETGKTEEDSEV